MSEPGDDLEFFLSERERKARLFAASQKSSSRLTYLAVALIVVTGGVFGVSHYGSAQSLFSDAARTIAQTALSMMPWAAQSQPAAVATLDEGPLYEDAEYVSPPDTVTTDTNSAAPEIVKTKSLALAEPVQPAATINNIYPVQSIIERVLVAQPAQLAGYVTQEQLMTTLESIRSSVGVQLYGPTYPAPNSNPANGGIVGLVGSMGRIEKLTDLELTNATVNGISGLTDADIPDSLTLNNPTITGSLNLGFYTATSTETASTFPYASSTALSTLTLCLDTDCRTSWPSGGGSSGLGHTWELFGAGSYLAPTTTKGIIVNASSTIGNGTQIGGLTVSGGATTTGDASILGSLVVSGASMFGSATSTTFAITGTPNALLSTNAQGTVVATTSIGTLFGGTGLSTAPAYGQLLMGLADGTYTLVATSSLGISGGSGSAFGQAFELQNGYLAPTTTRTIVANGGVIAQASSTFLGINAQTATITQATSTSLFSSLIRTTTGIIDTLSAVTAGVTNLTTANATTSNMAITNVANALLSTNALGSVVATTSISSNYLDTTGNWSGTFDGQEGSYYLNAQNLTNFGSPFYTFFSATTTTALTEGSNLYFTNERADDRVGALLQAGSGITLNYNDGADTLTISAFGGGGGSDVNWTYFNGSGIYPSTSTNQVIVGGTATSSLLNPFAKLGVIGGASFDTATSSRMFANVLSGFSALFGGSATTTIDSAGNVAVAGTLGVTGNTTLANATSTNLALTNVLATILKTNASGSIVPAIAGTDYVSPSQIFAYPFANNATTTGLGIYASSTIGSGTPGGGLTISGGATTTGVARFLNGQIDIGVPTNPGDFSGVTIAHNTSGNGNLYFNMVAAGDSDTYGEHIFHKSGGTVTSPSAVANGDIIGDTWYYGHDGDSWVGSASIGGVVDGVVSTGVIPMALTFGTSNAGSGTERLRITSGGLVGIGTSTPYAKLSVVGDAVAARFVATTSIASIFPFASSTAVSATTICLTSDCRTSWPTSGGQSNWSVINGTSYVTPSSTIGFIVNASSTVGNGTQTGGLTISGGATTTGNAYVGGTLQLANALGATSGGTGLSNISWNQLLIGGANNTWTQIATSSLGFSSANTTFLQGGNGAITRTTQNKLREIEVNVMDFGAVGDGVTDDTAAIQAAIDYVSAQSVATEGPAGRVVAPSGYKFRTSAPLKATTTPIVIDFRSFIEYDASTGSAFVIGTTTANSRNTGFDVYLQGVREVAGSCTTPTTVSSSGSVGVEIVGMQFSKFHVGKVLCFTKFGVFLNSNSDALPNPHIQDNAISLGEIAYNGIGLIASSSDAALGAVQVNKITVQNSFTNWVNFQIGTSTDNNTNNNIFEIYATDNPASGGSSLNITGWYNDFKIGYLSGTTTFDTISRNNVVHVLHTGPTGVQFADRGTGNVGSYLGSNGIRTESATYSRNDAGNIGIGTSTPFSRLSVWGGSTGSIFEAITNASSSALTISASGAVGVGAASAGGLMELYENTGGAYQFEMEQAGAGDSAMHFLLTGTSELTMGIDNSDSDKFKIARSGTLGSSDQFVMDIAGNVGIGTSSPYAKLSVAGDIVGSRFISTSTSASIFPFASSTAFTTATLCLSSDCRTSWPSGGSSGSNWNVIGGNMYLTPSSTIGVILSASSTIGSGTQAGGLTISGGATTTGNAYVGGNLTLDRFSSFKIDGTTVLSATSTSSNIFGGLFAGANNISTSTAETSGIRNTAFGHYALFNATSSDSNTAIGYQALYNTRNYGGVNDQGYRNTAIGDSVLLSNTSGSFNTAAGYNSMYNNTTGTSSAAYGNLSLFANTTGYANTALGNAVLTANTTGYYNTGVGNAAAESITTGFRNVAIGQGALRTATSSNNNVAVGQSSLMFLSDNAATGPNTALGSSALMQTTYGGSNVAVGFNAATANTTGSYNTIVGLGALEAASAASESVALGYRALSIASGSNNIAIGSQTGDALTSGTNNILIGYNIDASSAGGSNQLNIGNLIFGTGIDGQNTSVSSGNIGIGTSSPYAKLSVAGDIVGSRFISTSTSASIFPFASSTALTASTLCLSSDCRTSWPSGGSSGSNWNVVGGNMYLTPSSTIGVILSASSTIGNGTQAGGLTISGGATTTGNLAVQGAGTSTFAGGIQGATGYITGLLQAATGLFNSLTTSNLVATNSSLGYASTTQISSSGNAYLATAGGNVGIGTSTPNRTLSVLGTALFGSTPTSAGILLQTNGSYGEITGINHANNVFNGLNFTTGGTPSISINTTGYVGVGTTTPAHKLDVFGTAQISGTLTIRNPNISHATGSLHRWENVYASSTYQYLDSMGIALYQNTAAAQDFSSKRLLFQVHSNPGRGENEDTFFPVPPGASIGEDGGTYLATNAFDIVSTNGLRMIQVNTTPTISSGQILSVSVDSSIDSYTFTPTVVAYDFNGTGSGAQFTANMTGGTVTSITVDNPGSNYSADTIVYVQPSATAPLDLGPQINISRDVANTATSSYLGYIYFQGRSTGSSVVDTVYASIGSQVDDPSTAYKLGKLVFSTGGPSTLNAGNNPRFYIGRGLFSAYVAGGDKGIDTINLKGYYLDGNKIINASSTTGTLSVGINAVTSNYATSTTLGTTGIGFETLQNATSSLYNTAIGYQALKSVSDYSNGSGIFVSLNNRTGSNNTAVGYQALTNNTAGTFNTAVGFQALSNVSTSSYNTAVGYRSLYQLSTGRYNTALGEDSLFSNTNGEQNTAVGQAALLLNISGIHNAVLGQNAMYNDRTGSYNTVVGSQALYQNMSATGTVAIGFQAGGGLAPYSNQGGTYLGFAAGISLANSSNFNTLLGYQAGYDVTSGANNTIIGQYPTAGTGVTEGSGNILIGNGVRAGLSQTGSNQLNIGNLIFGTNVSSATTVSTGNIGVGTSSPWRTFSAAGTVGFDGLTGSTGAGSLCLDSNKQVVYNSASDACLSSTRNTKNTIQPLTLEALHQVLELEPVSFVYNQGDGRVRYGFIAEDTAAVDDHLATHDAEGIISGIDDRAILSVVVKALQEIYTQITSLSETISGFAQQLITEEIIAVNGSFETLRTTQLCVGSICITESQFMAVFGGTASQPAAVSTPAEDSAPDPESEQGAESEPDPETVSQDVGSEDASDVPAQDDINEDEPALVDSTQSTGETAPTPLE